MHEYYNIYYYVVADFAFRHVLLLSIAKPSPIMSQRQIQSVSDAFWGRVDFFGVPFLIAGIWLFLGRRLVVIGFWYSLCGFAIGVRNVPFGTVSILGKRR